MAKRGPKPKKTENYVDPELFKILLKEYYISGNFIDDSYIGDVFQIGSNQAAGKFQLKIKDLKLNLIGVPDGDPIVGKTYGINGNWYTSPIIKIIDNCVLITENSISAIHHISKIREDKLKQLGI